MQTLKVLGCLSLGCCVTICLSACQKVSFAGQNPMMADQAVNPPGSETWPAPTSTPVSVPTPTPVPTQTLPPVVSTPPAVNNPPVVSNPPAPAPAANQVMCSAGESIQSILQHAQYCVLYSAIVPYTILAQDPSTLVYTGYDSGFVATADPNTGEFQITYPVDGDVSGTPWITVGATYVGVSTMLTVGTLEADLECYQLCN